MADFSKAIPKILKSEGGYTKNPDDGGNYQCQVGWAKRIEGKYVCPNGKLAHLTGTNRGIAANTLRDWKKRIVSDAEMINLTEQEATNIYKNVYWDAINGDAITDQAKAEILFDAQVNQTGWVITMLSDTVGISKGSIKYPLSATVIAKINSEGSFVNKFATQREKRYKETALRPGQDNFLVGWLDRLSQFRQTIRGKKTLLVKIGVGVLILGIFVGIIYAIKKNKKT